LPRQRGQNKNKGLVTTSQQYSDSLRSLSPVVKHIAKQYDCATKTVSPELFHIFPTPRQPSTASLNHGQDSSLAAKQKQQKFREQQKGKVNFHISNGGWFFVLFWPFLLCKMAINFI